MGLTFKVPMKRNFLFIDMKEHKKLVRLPFTTVVPELMKISHFFSYLSDSKDQTIIEKVLLANDRGN